MQKEHVEPKQVTARLLELLNDNAGKRVIVVGTTCTGKSTLLKSIKYAKDMDALVFPKLTKAEADYVCSKPWTEDIGKTMSRLAKEHVKVEAGEPVFGTVVLDCDLIIYLKIDDKLLRERTKLRGHGFDDAKNMQKSIEQEIRKSGRRTIELEV